MPGLLGLPNLSALPVPVPTTGRAVREVVGGAGAALALPVRAMAAGLVSGAENALVSSATTGRRTAAAMARLPSRIADVVTVLTDVGERRGRRRLWSRAGRAHIEVRGLTGRGDRHNRLAAGITTELRRLEGVDWAEVNAITGQVLIAFDEEHLDVDQILDVVETVEEAHGTHVEPFPGKRPHHPFETAPATLAAAGLVADCLGLALAAAGRVLPVPTFPRAARAPVVFAETQPRMRRALAARLGVTHADVLLAVSSAVLHALTEGVVPLGVDALHRLLQLAEIRSRQAVWSRREAELAPHGGGLPREAHERVPRPAPLPDGPVEICANRTSAAALFGAGGVLAWTRCPGRAAEALLATIPKAARVGREGFATLTANELARRGVVPMDAAALRRLDRVSAVVIDSAALCTSRPRLLSAVPTGELDDAEVWRAAHSMLVSRSLDDFAGDGPWAHDGWRMERAGDAVPGRPDGPAALTADLVGPGGRRQGRVQIGCELDPLADALVGAARSAAGRLVFTEHASTTELLPWADEVLSPGTAALADEVRRLQQDGHGVLLVAAGHDDALDAADVGVAVLRQTGGADGPGVCWSADLICGPGLAEAWRVLFALREAHAVSIQSARLSIGGSVLGALLATLGTRRTIGGRTTSPVYGAAVMALVVGVTAARRVRREPVPRPRVRGAWHALGARETFTALRAIRHVEDGDGEGDARQRAQRYGAPVRLARGVAGAVARTRFVMAFAVPPARGTVALLTAVGEELRDPMTPVLALGAAASAVVGSGIDALLVAGVMGGNALISGVQRVRAERALRGLLLGEQVNARRVPWAPSGAAAAGGQRAPGSFSDFSDFSDSSNSSDFPDFPDFPDFFDGLEAAPVETVRAQDLRVGDIIALDPSDVVPADARLLLADGLELDEASLTGESVPVAKNTRPAPGADLGERSCMVYQGSTVLAGTGHAVVTATGAQTEAGRAADVAEQAGAPAGIEGHLATLTSIALPATGLGGAAVTLLAVLRGASLREALASGVAVAVAAVPEGLPLVATVAQSAAARRLSRRGVLVRSARVLEALGRVDTACFDKTGTLTEGRLAVARVAGFDRVVPTRGPLGRRLLLAAARACPEAGEGRTLTHATDRAVVDAAATLVGPDEAWRLTADLPFEASRGYAASLGTESGRPYLAVKGAPEIVLAECTRAASPSRHDEAVTFGPAQRRAAQALLQRLASGRLRVLAIAEARPESLQVPAGTGVAGLVTGLTLVGFIAIADTVRPGAAATVERLTRAGVRVTVITGDHPTTAAAIARELGVQDADTVLTGAELDTLPERVRVARIARTAVFARVSPEQKVRIVQALQRAGRVVGMVGDGINDAAAIRVADVGIGVSTRGSVSARTAADLVLTDPDPALILDALLEGRALWGSVRDAVAILVGGNAGEVAFTVLGTAIAGRAPLGTRQLLLVNMLTDMLPALAVALAPAEHRGLGQDPLADGPVTSFLGPDLARILAVRGGATALGAAAAWQCGRMTGRDRRASTMGLAALVGTQLGQTLITDWHSPVVLATSAISAASLVAIVETPVISHFFGCTPLGPAGWGVVAVCATAATTAAAVAPRVLFRERAPLEA